MRFPLPKQSPERPREGQEQSIAKQHRTVNTRLIVYISLVVLVSIFIGVFGFRYYKQSNETQNDAVATTTVELKLRGIFQTMTASSQATFERTCGSFLSRQRKQKSVCLVRNQKLAMRRRRLQGVVTLTVTMEVLSQETVPESTVEQLVQDDEFSSALRSSPDDFFTTLKRVVPTDLSKELPSPAPTLVPTSLATPSPTIAPTRTPTQKPVSSAPTNAPTPKPTAANDIGFGLPPPPVPATPATLAPTAAAPTAPVFGSIGTNAPVVETSVTSAPSVTNTTSATQAPTIESIKLPPLPATAPSPLQQEIENLVGKEIFENKELGYQQTWEWMSTDSFSSSLQRFFVAYLYFATKTDSEWNNCGPDPTVLDANCTLEHPHSVSSGQGDQAISVSAVRWLSGVSECEWGGVSCQTNTDIVTALDLSGQGLVGPFPEGMRYLSTLKALTISYNRLSGELSDAVLPFLTSLRLDHNEFSGSIPTAIGLATNLNRLSLHNNHLKGSIPEELYSLSSLRHLDLANNTLTGTMSETIGQLELLTTLRLQHNSLSGEVPFSNLLNATSLEVLALHGNEFSGSVPEAMCRERGTGQGDLRVLEVPCAVDCPLSGCCDGHDECA